MGRLSACIILACACAIQAYADEAVADGSMPDGVNRCLYKKTFIHADGSDVTFEFHVLIRPISEAEAKEMDAIAKERQLRLDEMQKAAPKDAPRVTAIDSKGYKAIREVTCKIVKGNSTVVVEKTIHWVMPGELIVSSVYDVLLTDDRLITLEHNNWDIICLTYADVFDQAKVKRTSGRVLKEPSAFKSSVTKGELSVDSKPNTVRIRLGNLKAWEHDETISLDAR